MSLAQEALVARERGSEGEALELFRQALQLEKEAANSLLTAFDSEPTRGILFRSAATLALDCNEYREAERLVNQGLAGNPTEEIAEELRNIYEDVNLSRHLSLEEVELTSTEIQMSLSGNQVGFGVINSEEFIGRYKKFELLTYRTAERKSGKEFRTSGRVGNDVKEIFQPYLSVPRAASFAVTIRVGKSQNVQLDMFTGNNIQNIIDEIVKGIELINKGSVDALKDLIDNDNYYQNFVSLTKAIAPDGDKIKQVGFTVKRGGDEVNLGLIRPRKEFGAFLGNKEFEEDKLTIEGLLKVADATKNKISIIENETKVPYNLDVPDGLNDIVKEYWDSEVFAFVQRKGRKYKLIEIEGK